MLLGCSNPVQNEISEPTDTTFINSRYDIQKESGEYYLILNEQPEVTGYSAPFFSSLSEMKKTILTGGLTDQNLVAFQNYPPKNGEMRIELYNLDHLYEPIVPDNVEIGTITFFGRWYRVSLEAKSNEFWSGSATFYKESTFEKTLSDRLNGIDSKYQTIVENGIEKKIHEYENEISPDGKQYVTSAGKSVYYQLEKNGVSFHVFESFAYSTGFSCIRPSKEYPQRVTIYVEDGNYAEFSFDTLNMNPSVDWILALGSKPVP